MHDMEQYAEVTKLASDLGELRATARATDAKVDELRASMSRLTDAMTAVVRLDVEFKQHVLAIDALRARQEAIEGRVDLIERDMPGLRETRGWVVRLMLMVVSAVSAAVLGLVLIRT